MAVKKHDTRLLAGMGCAGIAIERVSNIIPAL
jgi:hypothetical protein